MDEKFINKFLLQSRYIIILNCQYFISNRAMVKKPVFDSEGVIVRMD